MSDFLGTNAPRADLIEYSSNTILDLQRLRAELRRIMPRLIAKPYDPSMLGAMFLKMALKISILSRPGRKSVIVPTLD